jgi:CheY-like chemotaxis protein/HPt (histidine-containing phosphotransfer) domain-containing protein
MSTPMTNPARSMSPLRLLLAEDHPVNQKLAVALLKKRGHDVTVVPDGQQAIDAWEASRFDVILMDVHMPVLGGLEATQAIRERERQRGGHVPIVALTALAMTSDRERCMVAGMDAFVTKPLDASELFATLERLLPAKRFSEATGASSAVRPTVMPVDPARLMQTVEGDESMLRDLVQTFFEESPAQERAIVDALGRKDAAALARAAHTFKGVLLTIAALPSADAARRLEMLARGSRLDDAPAALAELREELRRLDPALHSLMRRAA